MAKVATEEAVFPCDEPEACDLRRRIDDALATLSLPELRLLVAALEATLNPDDDV